MSSELTQETEVPATSLLHTRGRDGLWDMTSISIGQRPLEEGVLGAAFSGLEAGIQCLPYLVSLDHARQKGIHQTYPMNLTILQFP